MQELVKGNGFSQLFLVLLKHRDLRFFLQNWKYETQVLTEVTCHLLRLTCPVERSFVHSQDVGGQLGHLGAHVQERLLTALPMSPAAALVLGIFSDAEWPSARDHVLFEERVLLFFLVPAYACYLLFLSALTSTLVRC